MNSTHLNNSYINSHNHQIQQLQPQTTLQDGLQSPSQPYAVYQMEPIHRSNVSYINTNNNSGYQNHVTGQYSPLPNTTSTVHQPSSVVHTPPKYISVASPTAQKVYRLPASPHQIYSTNTLAASPSHPTVSVYQSRHRAAFQPINAPNIPHQNLLVQPQGYKIAGYVQQQGPVQPLQKMANYQPVTAPATENPAQVLQLVTEQGMRNSETLFEIFTTSLYLQLTDFQKRLNRLLVLLNSFVSNFECRFDEIKIDGEGLKNFILKNFASVSQNLGNMEVNILNAALENGFLMDQDLKKFFDQKMSRKYREGYSKGGVKEFVRYVTGDIKSTNSTVKQFSGILKSPEIAEMITRETRDSNKKTHNTITSVSAVQDTAEFDFDSRTKTGQTSDHFDSEGSEEPKPESEKHKRRRKSRYKEEENLEADEKDNRSKKTSKSYHILRELGAEDLGTLDEEDNNGEDGDGEDNKMKTVTSIPTRRRKKDRRNGVEDVAERDISRVDYLMSRRSDPARDYEIASKERLFELLRDSDLNGVFEEMANSGRFFSFFQIFS